MSALVGLSALAFVDVALSYSGFVPEAAASGADAGGISISPFETRAGVVSIRAEWVNGGRMYEFTEGDREGQFFLDLGFHPTSFTVLKPPGTLRVFALGASTTFGLRVAHEAAFPALIGDRLEALMGADRPVEVVNLGCPGCGSTHVLGIAKTVLGYDPDLLLVYMGENEMLRLDPGARPGSPTQRARELVLQASSLAKWLDHGLGTVSPRPAAREVSETDLARRRIEVHSRQGVGGRVHDLPSASTLAEVQDRFESNLESLVGAARAAGVPLVLVAPVSNLLWLPGGSGLPHSFVDTTAVVSRVDLALASAERGDVAGARRLLREAVSLAPSFAEAWYHLGRAEIALGHADAGLATLREARDRDAWTHRITSPLEARLVEVAGRRRVPLADPRASFAAALTQSEIDRLFLDHVHPTVEGHRVLADAIWPAVREALSGAPEPR
jgi:lysophospholipase L1-like esterase